MTRALPIVLSTLLAFASGAVQAACKFPETIAVPDGQSASRDEMLAARDQVNKYMDDMNKYLGCLEKESAKAGEDQTDEQKALHTSRHNAAVDTMQEVANNFNEQLRAYNAANQ